MQVLVQVLVILRLDYCNLLLTQNPAAWLVFHLPKFCHTAPLLHTLHWHQWLLNPIQDSGTGLLCCEWLRPILHPGHGHTLQVRPSTTLCFCQMACYSLTTRGAAPTAQQNPDSLLSWIHNDGTSSPTDFRTAETLHIFRLKTHLSRMKTVCFIVSKRII